MAMSERGGRVQSPGSRLQSPGSGVRSPESDVGRAVFLDKDGTLIDDVPYNVDPSRIRLADGAAAGVVRLHRAGYRVIVVSNQSGVAHGFFAEDALAAVEARLRALLGDLGVPLAGFYYCPHHPGGVVARYRALCGCRKPAPGMLHEAARDLGIDLTASWLVGDILHDIEAGHRAGCRAVLLDNGHETEWDLSGPRTPDHVAADLDAAAMRILAADAGRVAPCALPAASGARR
jgi:D-glycero-D-manno-heptose 1,7-bisphosphate phosphatase